MRDRIVELRRVPASDLQPNPKNWRQHPAARAAALSGILNEIGYADAVLARETPAGLVLIDGHLRAELSEDAEIPVLILDVTEEEADKILLTLDPLAAMAGLDGERLAALLASVETSDDAVLALMDELARQSGAPVTVDEDEVPDAPEKPVTQLGDLWEMETHRLLCGDATSAADLERLMSGSRGRLLWTDPPYGVSYVGKTRDALTMQSDDAAGLRGLIAGFCRAATSALEPSSPFYVAAPAGRQLFEIYAEIEGAGWQYHQALVWVKSTMVLGHSDYHFKHENLLYGWVPGEGRAGRGRHQGTRWFGDHSQTSVLEFDKPVASRDHPTSKPVGLVAACIVNSSRPRDIVLDCFGGSGTTLIASDQLSRQCRIVELDPRYCDVIVERWQNLTGGKAKRIKA